MRRYQVNFGFRISEFGIGLKTHGILHLFSIPKLILILSMAISIGCAKKEEVTPTPTGGSIIVGVVKSEGKPLEGVTVSIEALGVSSRTGSDGSFKMTDLVEGAYKVSFEKEGYVKKEVEVTVGAEGTVNIGEIELELSGSIEGIAKIEGEEVHKGIKVRVIELEGLEVETDSEGRYVITGIPSGSYTLELSAPGFDPKRINVDVEGGKVSDAGEVVLSGRTLPRFDKLVLWLRFVEGTGTKVKDFSGKGNNGVATGSVQWVEGAMGKGDKAMRFEQGSYLNIPGSDSLGGDIFRNPFTVAAWIKPDLSGDQWQHILRSKPLGSGHNTLFVNIDGRLSWRGFVSGTWTVLCETQPGLVKAGEWAHVAVVGDGSKYRIYVNGSIGAETPFIQTDGGIQNFFLAFDNDQWMERYSGVIDEFCVWVDALKEDEIRFLTKR